MHQGLVIGNNHLKIAAAICFPNGNGRTVQPLRYQKAVLNRRARWQRQCNGKLAVCLRHRCPHHPVMNRCLRRPFLLRQRLPAIHPPHQHHLACLWLCVTNG